MKWRLPTVIVALVAGAWLAGCSVHGVSSGKPETGVTKAAETASGERAAIRAARMNALKGVYKVRTIWKDAPLPRVLVEWRRQIDDEKPALVGETIRFGTANFRPETGTYYLTAEWRKDGNFTRPRRPGDRFAWLGANPLRVSSEVGGGITLTLDEVPPPPTDVPSGTGIYGRVTLDGAPVPDVGIFAYTKDGSGFKGNDYLATVRANAKGEFTLPVPPGRYYLLARLRSNDSVRLGPLHKGDLLGYDPGNPVVVEDGRYATTAIPLTRLRMIKLVESPEFAPAIIEGRIVDREGHPVSGVYAALYDNLRMIGRSVYRSDPAGADGRFRLSVPVPGSYFLGARSGYGGAPAAGTWFGTWPGSVDHSIELKTGEVRSGIDVVVTRLKKQMGPGSH